MKFEVWIHYLGEWMHSGEYFYSFVTAYEKSLEITSQTTFETQVRIKDE